MPFGPFESWPTVAQLVNWGSMADDVSSDLTFTSEDTWGMRLVDSVSDLADTPDVSSGDDVSVHTDLSEKYMGDLESSSESSAKLFETADQRDIATQVPSDYDRDEEQALPLELEPQPPGWNHNDADQVRGPARHASPAHPLPCPGPDRTTRPPSSA